VLDSSVIPFAILANHVSSLLIDPVATLVSVDIVMLHNITWAHRGRGSIGCDIEAFLDPSGFWILQSDLVIVEEV
jgi:hypothetical protein